MHIFKIIYGLCVNDVRTVTVLVLHGPTNHYEARRLGGFTGRI